MWIFMVYFGTETDLILRNRIDNSGLYAKLKRVQRPLKCDVASMTHSQI